MIPNPETIPSTAPGTTQKLQASPSPEENSSDATSKKPSSHAPNHTKFQPLASDKKNIFFWYAAVIKDTLTEDTIQNTATKQQNQDLDVHNNNKLDGSFVVDENKIANTLTTMHSSLCNSEFKKHREYCKCPTGTVEEIKVRLATLTKEDEQARRKPRDADSKRRHSGDDSFEQDSRESDHEPDFSASASDSDQTSTSGRAYHRLLERKRKFVSIMKKLFQLFLPLRYTSEMTSKYWGAVNLLLQVLHLDLSTKRIILTCLAESRFLLAMA